MKMGILALACLLLATFAGAFTAQAPMGEVRFSGQPVEYAFTVTNDSRMAEPLTASMQIVNYLVIEKPAFVQPNETVKVRLRLLPRNDLLGMTYQSTLTVKLGEETQEFPITLIFSETAAETVATEGPSAPVEPMVAAEKPVTAPAEQTNAAPAALVVMPQLPQEAMNELLFNVALAVIVALLLISFLARLTKKMVERRS